MHGRDNRGNLHEEEKLFYVIFDDDIVFSLFQIWILYDWRKVGIRREIFYKDTLFQGSLIRWNKGNSAMETLRFIQTPPVSTRLGLNSYRHASPWASLELYLIQSLKYGITSWGARKIWNPTTHLIVDGKKKGIFKIYISPIKQLRIQAPRILCFSSDQRFHFNVASENHLSRPTSPGQVDVPLGNSWLGHRGDQPVGTKHECAINLRSHCNSLWLLSFVSSTQSSISPGDWPSTTTSTSNQASYSFNLTFITVLVHTFGATFRKHVDKNQIKWPENSP